MLRVAFLIMILLAAMNVALIYKKINIIKLAVFTVIGSTSVYILVSGLLFWIDRFSIQKAVLICIAIWVAAGIILWKMNGLPEFSYEIKSYMIPIVVTILCLPLVWTKYEYYGMGQDEGVYQTHAILLMYGQNDVQMDIEEYHLLESDEEKSYYKEKLNQALTGYYIYDPNLETTSAEKQISDISGTIHGIPTYAALLALWGRVFGLEHMVGIQTLFYICALFMMYILTDALALKKINQLLACGILAVCPVILWSAKSSLTEMFLVVLVLLFMYGLVHFNSKMEGWWAVAAMIVFAFFHFTIYTILPMVICIYLGLFLVYRERRYGIQGIVVTTGCWLGICMACFVGPAYTIGGYRNGIRTGNFKPLYELFPWINEQNVLLVYSLGCLAAVILFIVLLLLRNYLNYDFRRFRCIGKIGLKIVMVLALAAVIVRMLTDKTDDKSWLHVFNRSTFAGYAMLTGGILLMILCVLWLIKTDILVRNMQYLLLAGVFIYCILIYTLVFRPTVQYYYYFGRYQAPFIGIILVMAGILFNEFKGRYSTGILAVSVMALMPYLPFFYNEIDDTMLRRDTLMRIESNVEHGSIVIMNEWTGKYLYLPIRTMTGAEVYFEEENLEEQVEKLSEENRAIYYISIETPVTLEESGLNYSTEFRVVDAKSDQCGYMNHSYFPFPTYVNLEQTIIGCYRIESCVEK